jgi:hypothetical protein
MRTSVSADQRDNFGLYEMLDILQFGAVEIHRATAAFNANGKQYPRRFVRDQDRAALWRLCEHDVVEAGLPGLAIVPRWSRRSRPYDVTGHTLWMLTGVGRRRGREAV